MGKCGKDQNTHLFCQRAEHHWKTVEHFLKFKHTVLCRLLRENHYQQSWSDVDPAVYVTNIGVDFMMFVGGHGNKQHRATGKSGVDPPDSDGGKPV